MIGFDWPAGSYPPLNALAVASGAAAGLFLVHGTPLRSARLLLVLHLCAWSALQGTSVAVANTVSVALIDAVSLILLQAAVLRGHAADHGARTGPRYGVWGSWVALLVRSVVSWAAIGL